MISLTKDYKIFVLSVALLLSQCYSLSVRPLSPSKFVGASLFSKSVRVYDTRNDDCMLTMRKQKASNKRTRRLQKGNKDEVTTMSYASSIATPTGTASWNHKIVKNNFPSTNSEGGRGRSRKRSQLYNSLASYHSQFLKLITEEFLAEVSEKRQKKVIVLLNYPSQVGDSVICSVGLGHKWYTPGRGINICHRRGILRSKGGGFYLARHIFLRYFTFFNFKK